MNINEILAELKNAKLYYDAAFQKCRSQGQLILLVVRKRCGYTQEEMAMRLDCSASYISKVENGHCPASKPILSMLAEIVEKLEAIDNDIDQG